MKSVISSEERLKLHFQRIALARVLFKNPNAFLNSYYCMSNSPELIELREGGRFWVRSRPVGNVGDPDIADEIFLKDAYNIDTLVRPGDNILDLGAHAGYFSVLAASRGANRIVSVEPELSNYCQLELNIRSNPTFRIRPVFAGIAPSQLRLAISAVNNGGHSMSMSDSTATTRTVQDCPILSPAEAFGLHDGQQIDLLKVDCEGAEEWIFAGAPLQGINRVVVETHDFDSTTRRRSLVQSRLEDAGFACTCLVSRHDSEGRFAILAARRISTAT